MGITDQNIMMTKSSKKLMPMSDTNKQTVKIVENSEQGGTFEKNLSEFGSKQNIQPINVNTKQFEASGNMNTINMPNGQGTNREALLDGLGQTGENNMGTVDKTMDVSLKQTMLHKELFENDPISNKIILCDQDVIDFGYCNALQLSGQRELSVTNTSGTKITVSWTRNYTENSDIPIFSVNPQSANLKAGETYTFMVNFRPTHRSAFFFLKLQAIAINYEENLSEFLSGAGVRMRKRNIKGTKTVSIKENYGMLTFPPVM